MYHAHLRGTHYEAGFRWGSLLLRHKNIILNNIPFEITGERMEYAQSCVPAYEKYYPEILDEIQGLADGQQCDVCILQAVLFSMYAIPPACNCSCFAFVTEKDIFLGRNSDFLTDMERLNQNVIYKLTDGTWSFTGNTTAFIEMEDGINEHGLAAGLTSVYPVQRKPGLNAGLLLRYFLEKCKTVSEVISCLGRLPIASAQTFTLADAKGDIAVIECNSERMKYVRSMDEIYKPLDFVKKSKMAKGQDGAKQPAMKKYVCATNLFHLPEMDSYNNWQVDNWFAERRYQTLTAALNQDRDIPSLFSAEELLSGKQGFLCQYDRSTGKDTVWSVIYDVKQHKIYRSEGNPVRYGFKEDIRFRF